MTTAAPADAPAAADAPAVVVPAPSPPGDAPLTVEEAPRGPSVLGPFLVHLACFVGAGLVSGGIVHRPLDPGRYTVLTAVGLVVFLAATFVGEVVLGKASLSKGQLLRLALGALLLSFGIGCVSGGVQHFTDVPTRAAVLVPLGLVLGWLGWAVRGEQPLVAGLKARGSIVVLVLALVLAGALHVLAGRVDVPAGGHSHGAPAAEAAHTDAGHAEAGHADASPGGAAHTDPAHTDPAHSDPAHAPAAPVPAEDLQQQLRDLQATLEQLDAG